jgi:hypothetical protein
MSSQEEKPAPKWLKLPSVAALREMLWLPKLSLWGVVATILFIAVLGYLVWMILIRNQPQ